MAKIVVCDDDPQIRNLAERILTRLGHSVSGVGTGRELLNQNSDSKELIEIIILDAKLPDLSLKSILNGLNEAHGCKKVIISSGFYLDELEVSEMGLEIFLLPKPYTINELIETLNLCGQITLASGY